MFWGSCEEIDETVRSILEPTAGAIDRENRIPEETLSELQSHAFFSLDDISLEELLCRVRVASRYSPAVAHSLLVHASSWLASGRPSLERRAILALSVTEPGGGTDLRASLKTRAERAEGIIRVTGEKIFTSNAPYATRFVVLAIGPSGPTLYNVQRDPETIEYELLDLTGLRGTGASIVRYKQSPAEPAGTPGKGIKEALKGINLGRLGYGAIALGIIDTALRIIVETGERKVIFGRELLSYQGIKWRIANIYIARTSLESMISAVVAQAQGGWVIDPEKAAIIKVLAAEAAQQAAWAASQILGGRGLQRWSIADRLQRDARALDIGEGAREVLLDYISSQAVKAFR